MGGGARTVVGMTRADVLRELVVNGRDYGSERLSGLAAEFDLLMSDVMVIAGHQVPARLLPPVRESEVLREFAYRVTYCDHAQLASLNDFVLSLASTTAVPAPWTPQDVRAAPSNVDRFGGILDGLMRNRGFGIREMPFAGLSMSTIRGMLHGRWHNLQQLKAMAGSLGWRFEDLAAVAGEPLGAFDDCSAVCRHMGSVYVAAIPLTTAQLVQAAAEADRLSERTDHGAWRPVAVQANDCPDGGGRNRGV